MLFRSAEGSEARGVQTAKASRKQSSLSGKETQLGKNLTAVQETSVQFLGLEDFLEKEMATHSSILAWKIPWTEEPGRLQSLGLQESDMT